MADKTYLVKFKKSAMPIQLVIASTVEIHGEHLAMLDSNGRLAALFVMEVVESWSESPIAAP
jgi:hypothetical protein